MFVCVCVCVPVVAIFEVKHEVLHVDFEPRFGSFLFCLVGYACILVD